MVQKVNHIVNLFAKEGIKLKHLNLGGGLGVNYANPEEFANFEGYFNIF